MQILLTESAIEEIATRVKLKLDAEIPRACDGHDGIAAEYQSRLARIQVKENISVQEAAFLLNCSDGHLRNLIKKAKHKKTSHPIPFNDLDGLFTFNREELIVWSRNPKERLKKS